MTRRELLGLMAAPALAAPAAPVTAEVKPYHGAPTLFLNGQPSFSAAFWVSAPSAAKWDSAEASRRAAAAGVHTYAFDVGAGTEWVKPDYDFTTVKARFGRLLDADPEARFHLRCHLEIGVDDWWSKRHPQELELHSNGRRYTQSFASRVWREQANAFLRAYIQELSSAGLLDRVVAFQAGAGHTGEWVKGETSMYEVCGDYSEPMRREFRAWLRRRYAGNVEALRRAWGDGAVTFETAEVPPAQEQLHARRYLFRDPRREGRPIDYFRCLAELSASAVIDFLPDGEASHRGEETRRRVLWLPAGPGLERRVLCRARG